jgi:hypothetical protein
VAVVIFIISRLVWWPQMIVMMIAGVLGGYFGARVVRRVPAHRVRLGISIVSFTMTAAVFYRQLKN